jgi:hypothetical protein
LEEAAELLGPPVTELERQSLRAFLEKELRAARVEILAICQKYGVRAWDGMNKLIVEGTAEEGKIRDDFQRVDHFTAKVSAFRSCSDAFGSGPGLMITVV